jgi:hypothetical protein
MQGYQPACVVNSNTHVHALCMLCNDFPPHGNSSPQTADFSILEIPATRLGKQMEYQMNRKKNGDGHTYGTGRPRTLNKKATP